MGAVNTRYIRTIETELSGDSVTGDHSFDLDAFGPRGNTVEYFYFVDGSGDLVEPTGDGTVTITISPTDGIFNKMENGTFSAVLASSSERERPAFIGKSETVKVSFSGTITGAVGFRGLITENSEAPSSQEVHSAGGLNVNIQNRATTAVILPMVREIVADTTSVISVMDEYTVTLTSATGFVIRQHFRIISSNADRFYFGTILDINGNVITLDTPIDFAYPAGSEATGSDINMNVNGSVTPVVFALRTGSPSIPSVTEITRMIITCITDSAVDLNKFGDLAPLARGIFFRRVDGIKQNILNYKTNADIANVSFDFNIYAATNPSQGIDGFVTRLTFGGQNKIGTVLRIGQDENLEMIIQDDLTGLIGLRVILEGNAVPS